MAEKNYICAQCGVGFLSSRKRKYCAVSCGWRANERKRSPNAKPKQPATSKRRCKHCDKEYLYKPAGKDKGHEHKRRLFCSRVCRSALMPKSPPYQCKPMYRLVCVVCGVGFSSKRKRLHCGDACIPKRASVSVAPDVRACKCCGLTYKVKPSGGRPKEYCGDVCSLVVDSYRNRVNKAKRSALIKGVTVEAVDPFRVFDRDKWKCQLCGIKTPKLKRGSYCYNAPELDHIIPISKGGNHSYLNTQCSCRKCNGLKSNKPLGQMLLIG